jgi:hypothetical protein
MTRKTFNTGPKKALLAVEAGKGQQSSWQPSSI